MDQNLGYLLLILLVAAYISILVLLRAVQKDEVAHRVKAVKTVAVIEIVSLLPLLYYLFFAR